MTGVAVCQLLVFSEREHDQVAPCGGGPRQDLCC